MPQTPPPLSGKTFTTGVLMALGAVVLWAGNYIIARLIVGTLPPLTTGFSRWFIAFIFLLPFGWKHLRRDWPILRAHLPLIAAAAFFLATCSSSCLFLAGHTTTSVNMTLVATSSPIFMIVLSRIFNQEGITPSRLLGMLLAVFGIAWLITGGHVAMVQGLGAKPGDWWMLGCAFTFAWYSVLVQKFPRNLNPWSSLLAIYGIGFISLIPFVVWELARQPVVHFGVREWVSVFYLGLGTALLAFILWQEAIRRIGPARTGIIYYLLPLVTALFAVPMLGERITSTHLISAAFILAGVIIAGRR